MFCAVDEHRERAAFFHREPNAEGSFPVGIDIFKASKTTIQNFIHTDVFEQTLCSGIHIVGSVAAS